MAQKIKAIYRDGAFRPQTPCDFPKNSEVELLVQETSMRGPSIADPDERLRILRRMTERMQNNPLPADAPRFSRDELHERG